ncbi:transcriptional regulator, LacI family [Abditibacterium utsteinense]|uniref:Transcriptional regulator, LacI family n=1 Tax=Abditibacterium utsteinense TaxID=1960156 RepID=A0A2S8SQ60_9BACT|nr:LacI family DNA-binding transcriptional regulator [Abditibacterium utsteinense]PQV62931.1 transcriptional regulator, LacI family [Abditibacterium utsteinense]
MRATIRQIAQEAGVSHVTVSHVLRGVDSRTSAETRARVMETAQRLNYIPVKPPTAQNYHVETRVVTLVPEHHDVRYEELDLFTYQGVIEGARRHGYSVLTMVRGEEIPSNGRESLPFLDRSSDGFIFTVSLQEHWASVLDALAHNKVPSVVCYNRNVPQGVAWVDVDNGTAMCQAVEHLVKRGHTRIAYVAGPIDNFNANERRREWSAAMQEQGLDAGEEVIVQGVPDECASNNQAIASVTQMDVTAAVCFNDVLALALWDIAEAQGMSVPHDLSIIGMDNRMAAEERGLSSITHSFIEVGRLAMDAWVELKNGADAAACSKLASVKLVSRESVRSLNSWEPEIHSKPISIPNPLRPFGLDRDLKSEKNHEKSLSTAL